ncbi:phage tail protein [Pleionea sp. CnH1-48]|uniref:phage tail protein n=1 Tax=Pleionea sp. CnH1-48 TaxID=2954494 RepID=UPI002097F310|nr:tail fiber protein [Pleionea sp. CnH1-48]MCO7227297.1 tail fiber protein [Pleionea sp. CnH1-48]
MAEPFIGEIRIMPYTFAPRSWAACDGQLLPISQNTALFAIIGTIYGGDGRTTMGLPNLKARVPMHPGNGPGLTPRDEGEALGANAITLNSNQLPVHNHRAVGIRRAGSTNVPNNTVFPATDKDLNVHEYIQNSTSLTPMSGESLATYGGNQPHENQQPYLAMQFCIALEGLFPSRS